MDFLSWHRSIWLGIAIWLIELMVLCGASGPAAAQAPAGLADNDASIAVVIGNKDYRETVPVDYAHNDADAMKAYLVTSLGFRDTNVYVMKDATLNEFNLMFGTDRNPESGKLWRSVEAGRSNVFVYYSGHGVPDLSTKQPFLLPADGNPNQSESGYMLDTLYRNLELVKTKIGGTRQLVVMIDACFTGETGRKGQSLFAMSAPGFVPAQPKAGNAIVKLVATSGASPANWDARDQLGLFTSRFLMGVSGLADIKDGAGGGNGDGKVEWSELKRYVVDATKTEAQRDTGREQVPEIDDAPFVLQAATPVPAIAKAVAGAKDALNWRVAELTNTRQGFETYVGTCGEVCTYREAAMAKLLQGSQQAAAAADQTNWQTLSATKQYQAYLDGCGSVCAYRSVAEGYLGSTDPSHDPRVAHCDERAAGTDDPDRPKDVKGHKMSQIESGPAIEACRAAVEAQPKLRRLSYELGRALDHAGRYKEAFAAYKTAADVGSLEAMNNLGTLYEAGQGIKLSLPTALQLYEKAGEGGDAAAMANAGRMIQYGHGTARNKAEAVKWYKRAADAGDMGSITKLVPFYLNGGPGIPRDPQKGFDLFKHAADKGDPMAMTSMAVLIDNGFGSFFPGVRSTDMLLKALTKGDAGAAMVSATDTSNQKLKPATIKALQRKLKDDEYYDGAMDGRFNPVFVRALETYARAKEE